jgi:hypothetical protein
MERSHGICWLGLEVRDILEKATWIHSVTLVGVAENTLKRRHATFVARALRLMPWWAVFSIVYVVLVPELLHHYSWDNHTSLDERKSCEYGILSSDSQNQSQTMPRMNTYTIQSSYTLPFIWITPVD